MSKITLFEGASPGTPSTGQGDVYFSSSDKKLHVIDDAGVDTALGGGGGGGSTPYIVDAGGSTAYSTVQSAIDAAHTEFTSSSRYQVVLIRPADYTEDLTFKPGVAVMGTAEYSEGLTPPMGSAPDDAPRTVIIGQHTITQSLGAITGSARNIRFKSPATVGLGRMFEYGSGSTSPGAGQFTWANCLFDQSGNTFDERIINVNAPSATDDRLHFAECTFWMLTATAIPNFAIATAGGLYVSFKSCQLFSFSATHNAILNFPNVGNLTVSDCRLQNVRVDLGTTGSANFSIAGSYVVTGFGDAFLTSANVGNNVTVDETSIEVDGANYAIVNAMDLKLGAVAFSGHVISPYQAKFLTYSASSPRLHRGSVEGESATFTPTVFTPYIVNPNLAFAFCNTTSSDMRLVFHEPEQLKGATIRVHAGPNAATNNIQVWLRPSGSATEVINVNDQIVTYQSVFLASSWIWLRVAEL